MTSPGEMVYVLYDEATDSFHPEFSVGLLIGIYTTEAMARDAMEKMQVIATERGGRHEFTIDSMKLDETNWTEGYVTE